MPKEVFKEYATKSAIEETIQEALDILEADDGKSFEEKKEALIKHLQKHQEPVLIGALADLATADKAGQQIKDNFWSFGEITCPDRNIILRNVSAADREGYLLMQREYSLMKHMLNEPVYCEMVWNEQLDPKALMLTITMGSEYVGYCGIKNTTEAAWEIAIEILPQWTKAGIGYIALSGMLTAIKARLGIAQFRVRIDPSNYASQRLFDKLGAVPNGISEFLIHDQNALEKCEEENLHLIDEHLRTVADKFGVEPRKLLSHVLEFTLQWP